MLNMLLLHFQLIYPQQLFYLQVDIIRKDGYINLQHFLLFCLKSAILNKLGIIHKTDIPWQICLNLVFMRLAQQMIRLYLYPIHCHERISCFWLLLSKLKKSKELLTMTKIKYMITLFLNVRKYF